MKDLLPVLVVLGVLVTAAFAVGVGVVMLTSGSCGTSGHTVGTVLVYEIDQDAGERRITVEQEVLRAVEGRVNPGWSRRGLVRRRDDGNIEIAVVGRHPKTVDRIERMLTRPGRLAVRILANRDDHEDLIKQAEAAEGRVVRSAAGDVLAWWVPIRDPQAAQLNSKLAVRRSTRDNPQHEGQEADNPNHGDSEQVEVLAVKDKYDINHTHVASARADVDNRGLPCVTLILSNEGTQLFESLITDNQPNWVNNTQQSLAVLLDGQVVTIRLIENPYDTNCQIMGDFSREEVEILADILDAPTLPVALKQIERQTVGP